MAIVLVTGCSSGIGLHSAVALAGAGHRVFAAMRDPEAASALQEAAAAAGVAPETITLDVTNDGSVQAAIAAVLERAGGLDVLINNAGISNHGVVEETALERFRLVMETNFFGVVRCIQAVLPGMRAQGSGRIINVSSVSGRVAIPTLGAYAASKWALEALGEVLAQEVRRHGIRVLHVEPGNFATPMMAKAGRESAARSHSTGPPPAYEHIYARIGAFGKRAQAHLGSPQLVAEAITSLVAAADPPFRTPVGPDAERLLPARTRMADEEWLEIFQLPVEDTARRLGSLFAIPD